MRSTRSSSPSAAPDGGRAQPGDGEVRRQLRLVLKNNGLPPAGDLYARAYDYIREHYDLPWVGRLQPGRTR
jgi:hypothetical protein